MSDNSYTLTMARYNLWQNENLLSAADALTASERQKERGSFFGSIQKTFSHIFWADLMWMSRFENTPAPGGGISGSTDLITSWQQFGTDRKALDERILHWAHGIEPEWFEGDLIWFSGAAGRDVTRPKRMVVIHLFNHQTHHRGQIHGMLTAAGAKPAETDIPFIPERFLDR